MARTDPDPARARRRTRLAELIADLQHEPAGSPATLALQLADLERCGWTITAATDTPTLQAAAGALTRADEHAIILTRLADLPKLTRRAQLTRLTGPKPQHPQLRKLHNRATKRATATYKRTTGSGWALILELDSIALIAARADTRRLIARRTRDGMTAARNTGQRIGRPPTIPPDVTQRIHAGHIAGRSPRQIAHELQADGVPTVSGGPWRHSTIERALARPVQEPAEPDQAA